jgi:hypothetical protein
MRTEPTRLQTQLVAFGNAAATMPQLRVPAHRGRGLIDVQHRSIDVDGRSGRDAKRRNKTRPQRRPVSAAMMARVATAPAPGTGGKACCSRPTRRQFHNFCCGCHSSDMRGSHGRVSPSPNETALIRSCSPKPLTTRTSRGHVFLSDQVSGRSAVIRSSTAAAALPRGCRCAPAPRGDARRSAGGWLCQWPAPFSFV